MYRGSADQGQQSDAAIHATVLCNEDAPSEAILAGLERESIRIRLMDWSRFARPGEPRDPVLFLWLSGHDLGGYVRRVMERLALDGLESPAVLGHAPNGTVEDSIEAFEAGAHSFVAGRCSGRELACRIRAMHRRAAYRPTVQRYASERLSLDPANHEALVDSRPVQLTHTELGVLRSLLMARGETLTRLQILDQAWGQHSSDLGERAVDNVVLRLRRKLGDSSLIETVRGIGFRLGRSAVERDQHLSA